MWSKLPDKLKILLGSMILANIGGRLYRPFMPLYILSLGGTVAQVGVFYTVNTMSAAMLRPLGGWFSDSIGRLQAVGLGTLFGLGGMLGYALSPSWAWLLFSAVVLAFGRAVVGPSFRAFTAEAAPPEQMAQAFGLVNGVFNVVDVIGPALGGWVVTTFGLPSVFWWAVAFMSAATVLRVGVALGQPYRWERVRLASLRSGLSGMWLAIIGGGLFSWLLLTDSLRDFGISLFENFQPVLMQAQGLDEARIGVYYSLFAIVYLLVNLFGSRLSDRWSAAGALALGGLIQASGLVLLVFYAAPGIFPVYFVIVGAGLGLGDPAFDAMLARSAPGGHMGMTFGLFSTATSFLAMPAPYLGGLLYGRVSSLTPFWSGAIFLLAAAVFTWFYLRPHAERAAAQVSSAD